MLESVSSISLNIDFCEREETYGPIKLFKPKLSYSFDKYFEKLDAGEDIEELLIKNTNFKYGEIIDNESFLNYLDTVEPMVQGDDGEYNNVIQIIMHVDSNKTVIL